MVSIHPKDLPNLRVPPKRSDNSSMAAMQPPRQSNINRPTEANIGGIQALEIRKEIGALYQEDLKSNEKQAVLAQELEVLKEAHARLLQQSEMQRKHHDDKEAGYQLRFEELDGKLTTLTDLVTRMQDLYQACEQKRIAFVGLKNVIESNKMKHTSDGISRSAAANSDHAPNQTHHALVDDSAVPGTLRKTPTVTKSGRINLPTQLPKQTVVSDTTGSASTSAHPHTTRSAMQKAQPLLPNTPKYARADKKMAKLSQGPKTPLEDYVLEATASVKGVHKNELKTFIGEFVKGMNNDEQKKKLQNQLMTKHAIKRLSNGFVEFYCPWAVVEEALQATGLVVGLDQGQPSKKRKRRVHIPLEARI